MHTHKNTVSALLLLVAHIGGIVCPCFLLDHDLCCSEGHGPLCAFPPSLCSAILCSSPDGEIRSCAQIVCCFVGFFPWSWRKFFQGTLVATCPLLTPGDRQQLYVHSSKYLDLFGFIFCSFLHMVSVFR